MPDLKRQVAYKTWISNLMNGKYTVQEGWQPNYIQVNGKKISRVNILANVVDKFQSGDGNYATVTLDDGTDTVRVKTFREDTILLQDIKIGNILLVIGRPKEWQNEIYILPEIIKILDDPNWELVRKLELIKNVGLPKKEKVEEIKEEKIEQIKTEFVEEIVEDITETSRQRILTLIEKSEEEGIFFNDVAEKSGLDNEESEKVIQELLKDGEIYEDKPRHLKTV